MEIPYIPEYAPFTGDQRAWLSGFLAGLHSRTVMPGQTGTATATVERAAGAAVHILYGSQTGNAESVAEDAAAAARAHGLEPLVAGLDTVDINALSAMRRVLVITSTYGEGEMPDNAQLFWDAVESESAPRLEGLYFGVLALGDTSYDGYCQSGKNIDARFEALGGTRVVDRTDCDVDYEDPAAEWIVRAVAAVAGVDGDAGAAASPVAPAQTKTKSQWTRKNPYPATVLANRLLSGEDSAKEVRHFTFALGEDGLDYEAGDGLGIRPINDPALVEAIIHQLGVSGDYVVTAKDGSSAPLDQVLTSDYEISIPSRDLIEDIARRSGDAELQHILDTEDRGSARCVAVGQGRSRSPAVGQQHSPESRGSAYTSSPAATSGLFDLLQPAGPRRHRPSDGSECALPLGRAGPRRRLLDVPGGPRRRGRSGRSFCLQEQFVPPTRR